MKVSEYESGIGKFDLYGDAVASFLEAGNIPQIRLVIEVLTKFTGLVGEFGEFCEKLSSMASLDELIKEVSDVEWYLTRIENCLGFTKVEIIEACKQERSFENMTGMIKDFNIWVGKLGEQLKKIIRDENGNLTHRMPEFIEIFCQLEIQLMKIEGQLNRSKQEVLEVNYLKLKDRWERDVLHGSGDKR